MKVLVERLETRRQLFPVWRRLRGGHLPKQIFDERDIHALENFLGRAQRTVKPRQQVAMRLRIDSVTHLEIDGIREALEPRVRVDRRLRPELAFVVAIRYLRNGRKATSHFCEKFVGRHGA